MDILLFGLNATLPILVCMALGLFVRMRDMVDEDFLKKLNRIIYNIFIQFLLFRNISSIDFQAHYTLSFVLFAFGVVLCVIIATNLIARLLIKDKRKALGYAQIIYRSNYMMYGIAVLQNMYGAEGTQIGAMLIPVVVIPYNLISIALFSVIAEEDGISVGAVVGHSLVSVIKSPIFITSALGLTIGLSGIGLPVWLDTAVHTVSDGATPLCLLMMGAQIDWRSLRSNLHRVVLMSSIRLMVIPLIMVTICILAGYRDAHLAALFVLFASPCANLAMVMANQYDIEAELTAQCLAFTTATSSFTMFLGITLIRFLGFF